MNNSIVYSADYGDGNPDLIGLFDRIINIKFTRKNGETFTLRSDYEPIWVGDSLYFKTCQPKPEIRVQYTQFNATMINVDIYVTNLNIMEDISSKTTMDKAMIAAGIDAVKTKAKQGSVTNQPNDTLTRLGNVVTKAEIEMGYRGQFFNWATYQSVQDPAKDYEAFMNLEIPGAGSSDRRIIDSQSFFRKEIRKCNVVIEWATNISNPPDRITQFHGYVGATEAGFQPFALLSLDCASVAGAAGEITKLDIAKGLDDEYYTIEEVPLNFIGTGKNRIIDDASLKSAGTPHDLILYNNKTAYRNFFNGGKAFTLLEGYCFHMVTRRFVRSEVALKRNSLLEKAALDYALALHYPAGVPKLSDLAFRTRQNIYEKEQPFFPDYFVETTDPKTKKKVLSISEKASESFKEELDKAIDELLIEYYIGARYTIKDLPEYRDLYDMIRITLKEAHDKGIYLSWWDAAEQLGSTKEKKILLNSVLGRQQKASMTKEEIELAKDIEAVREYTLKLEQGDASYKDYYFNSLPTNDWVIPTQNLKTSVPLRNSSGRTIQIHLPTTPTKTGFAGKSERKEDARCFSGLFEVRDAYMFGVPVLCSEKASRIFVEKTAGSAVVPLQFMQEPQEQVSWICSTYGFRYYKMHNGGFYIYASEETSRDTMGQDFVKKQSEKPFRIPAIYDMTVTPIRKIRMPFMSFLNPMSLVEWNSSSMIGTMISFYYQPDKGRNFFMVIKNSVDFSTVGDFNTMEIDLVDAQYADPSEVPKEVIRQDNKPTYIETVIIPDNQTDSWRKIYESPVGLIPIALRPRWPESENIDSLLSAGGTRVSFEQFFKLFSAWNNTLFSMATEGMNGWEWADRFFRVDIHADRLFGTTRPEKSHYPDIPYCLDLIENPKLKRIYLKYPLMPNEIDYKDMNEYNKDYVLVYQSGMWEMRLKKEVEDPNGFNIQIGPG